MALVWVHICARSIRHMSHDAHPTMQTTSHALTHIYRQHHQHRRPTPCPSHPHQLTHHHQPHQRPTNPNNRRPCSGGSTSCPGGTARVSASSLSLPLSRCAAGVFGCVRVFGRRDGDGEMHGCVCVCVHGSIDPTDAAHRPNSPTHNKSQNTQATPPRATPTPPPPQPPATPKRPRL